MNRHLVFCASREGRDALVKPIGLKEQKLFPNPKLACSQPMDFRPKDITEPLHRLESNSMGKTLIDIKQLLMIK